MLLSLIFHIFFVHHLKCPFYTLESLQSFLHSPTIVMLLKHTEHTHTHTHTHTHIMNLKNTCVHMCRNVAYDWLISVVCIICNYKLKILPWQPISLRVKSKVFQGPGATCFVPLFHLLSLPTCTYAVHGTHKNAHASIFIHLVVSAWLSLSFRNLVKYHLIRDFFLQHKNGTQLSQYYSLLQLCYSS